MQRLWIMVGLNKTRTRRFKLFTSRPKIFDNFLNKKIFLSKTCTFDTLNNQ